MSIIPVLGILAAVFAALLLVFPAVRVAQGRLPVRRAAGLWISGAGFLLLASAALVLRGEAVGRALLAGIAATVIGNIVQRRATGPGSRA